MKKLIYKPVVSIVVVSLLIIGLGYYFFYDKNSFSDIEKIALLNIPRSAKLIERKVISTDFDGSEEAFFVLRLGNKEYDYLLEQCKTQSYKVPPVPNLDISFMGKYAETNDTFIYKLRNVKPPDYDLIILNMSKKILIVKHVKLY